jgi:hypothetical protein
MHFMYFILFESEWYKRWTQTLVYLHLRPTELKDVIIDWHRWFC